ncbi:predicted protein [Nematostella vectensis]|uniref:G-protein coupled receptors family 2 profile 2 domain-containing protein n=1 Tax=Nematostella vectensis TaxID=45351 RepID=A7SVP1_NEMVE|nr:predicted protein [Nematostella vectensis]|eukprot:XP_001624342.1 predicted protein [Nematostella vectensis]
MILQKVFIPEQASDFQFSYRNNINELTIQANVPWQNMDNVTAHASRRRFRLIDATRYTAVCVTAAAMLQLFLMAALFWMLLEGIQLYLQLVRVYNADMSLKLCYLFAWGIPVLVVGISLAVVGGSPRGIQSYTQLKACWISYNHHVIWTVVVPAALVIVINSSIFFRILKELSNMSNRQKRAQDSYSIVRNLKACLVLFPVLGITWSIGFVNMLDAAVVTVYLFTILDSVQCHVPALSVYTELKRPTVPRFGIVCTIACWVYFFHIGGCAMFFIFSLLFWAARLEDFI